VNQENNRSNIRLVFLDTLGPFLLHMQQQNRYCEFIYFIIKTFESGSRNLPRDGLHIINGSNSL
jgi:hypothetical protein